MLFPKLVKNEKKEVKAVEAATDKLPGVQDFEHERTQKLYTSEIGVMDIGYAGNKPGIWNGVPEDILKEYGFDPTKFFG